MLHCGINIIDIGVWNKVLNSKTCVFVYKNRSLYLFLIVMFDNITILLSSMWSSLVIIMNYQNNQRSWLFVLSTSIEYIMTRDNECTDCKLSYSASSLFTPSADQVILTVCILGL